MLSCARDQRLVDNDALTELVSTGKDFIEIRRLLTYGHVLSMPKDIHPL